MSNESLDATAIMMLDELRMQTSLQRDLLHRLQPSLDTALTEATAFSDFLDVIAADAQSIADTCRFWRRVMAAAHAEDNQSAIEAVRPKVLFKLEQRINELGNDLTVLRASLPHVEVDQ